MTRAPLPQRSRAATPRRDEHKSLGFRRIECGHASNARPGAALFALSWFHQTAIPTARAGGSEQVRVVRSSHHMANTLCQTATCQRTNPVSNDARPATPRGHSRPHPKRDEHKAWASDEVHSPWRRVSLREVRPTLAHRMICKPHRPTRKVAILIVQNDLQNLLRATRQPPSGANPSEAQSLVFIPFSSPFWGSRE
jgi:hypothetical protein